LRTFTTQAARKDDACDTRHRGHEGVIQVQRMATPLNTPYSVFLRSDSLFGLKKSH
jgi:hypothetical protein